MNPTDNHSLSAWSFKWPSLSTICLSIVVLPVIGPFSLMLIRNLSCWNSCPLTTVLLWKSWSSVLSDYSSDKDIQGGYNCSISFSLANHPHFLYCIFKFFLLEFFFDVNTPPVIWSSEFHSILDVLKSTQRWRSLANRAEFISPSLTYLFSKIVTETVSLLFLTTFSMFIAHGPQSLQDSMGMSERTEILIRKKIIFTSFGVMSSLSKTVKKCILTKSWVMPWFLPTSVNDSLWNN